MIIKAIDISKPGKFDFHFFDEDKNEYSLVSVSTEEIQLYLEHQKDLLRRNVITVPVDFNAPMNACGSTGWTPGVRPPDNPVPESEITDS